MPKSDLLHEIDSMSVSSTAGGTLITGGGGSGASDGFDETQADAWLLLKTTDDVREGATSLYYTDTRVSANTDVAANTAARHNALTIGTGGLSAKLALSAQELTLAAINHSDLSGIGASDHHAPVTVDSTLTLTAQLVGLNVNNVNSWTARQYFLAGLDASDAEIYGELHSVVFVKDETAIHAGDIMIVKSAGVLAADYIIGGTMTIKDPPSGSDWLFDTGDVVRIKAEYASGMGDTYITVTRTGTINQYTTVYKSGTNSITYLTGTGVADYGITGDGGIVIQSNAGLTQEPYIEGFTFDAAAPGTNPFFRLGELGGITDPTFGSLSGNGLYAKDVYLTGQFNISNGQDITNIDGGNIQTGTITATQVNSDFLTLGGGAGVTISDVSLHLPFTYAGNNRANTNGHLGQAPTTESGSVVGFADGKFGSGAVSLTEGFTNYVTNPVFDDLSGWTFIDGGTGGSETLSTDAYIGDNALNLVSGTSYTTERSTTLLTIPNGDSVSARCRLKKTATGTFSLGIRDATHNTTHYSVGATTATDWTDVMVSWTNDTGASVAVQVWLINNNPSMDVLVDTVQLTQTAYQLPFRYYGMPGVSGSLGSTSVVTASRLEYSSDVLSADAGTIAAWVKPSFVDTTINKLIYHTDGASSNLAIETQNDASSFRLATGTTTLTRGTVDVGNWQHVCLTWDSGTAAFYVNGVLSGSTWSYTGAAVGSNPIAIFANEAGSEHTAGELCGLTIAKSAYSATQIKAIYDSGVPVTVPHATHELMVAGDVGNRVWLNADGLFAEADVIGTPSFALVNNGVTWNGETLTAGDVLFGDNSTGKANILFDASTGTFSIRGGTTEQVTIAADGSLTAGNTTINANGVSLKGWTIGGVVLPDAEIRWYDQTSGTGTLLGSIYANYYSGTPTDSNIVLYGPNRVYIKSDKTGSTNGTNIMVEDNKITLDSYSQIGTAATSSRLLYCLGSSYFYGGVDVGSYGYKVNGTSVIDSAGEWADDSGWLDPSYATGWTYWDTGGWQPKYRKIGKLVIVRGLAKRTGSSTTWSTAFTLPTGYRPSKQSLFYAYTGGGASRLNIEITGDVKFETATTGTWHSVQAQFFID